MKKNKKMFEHNSKNKYPKIDPSAYIHISAIIIGKVEIGKSTFVGPGAVIRADEPGSAIVIHNNCNVQDNAVIHSLLNTTVEIDDNTSLAHSCVVHGPCRIGKRCFIGFGSIVFNSTLGDDVVVKHGAVVEEVKIPPSRVIQSGIVVDSDRKVEKLKAITDKIKINSLEVINVNLNLVKIYKNE